MLLCVLLQTNREQSAEATEAVAQLMRSMTIDVLVIRARDYDYATLSVLCSDKALLKRVVQALQDDRGQFVLDIALTFYQM